MMQNFTQKALKKNFDLKYVVYAFNENNKIIRENKGKIIKQNEFQQFVIEQ